MGKFTFTFDTLAELKAYVTEVENQLVPRTRKAIQNLKANGAVVERISDTEFKLVSEGATLSVNEANAVANVDPAYTDADTTNAAFADGFEVVAEVTDESVADAGDGTALAVPIGGKAPYTYLWDAAGGDATTALIEDLDDGDYVCTVTDADGNTGTVTATVAAGS